MGNVESEVEQISRAKDDQLNVSFFDRVSNISELGSKRKCPVKTLR